MKHPCRLPVLILLLLPTHSLFAQDGGFTPFTGDFEGTLGRLPAGGTVEYRVSIVGPIDSEDRFGSIGGYCLDPVTQVLPPGSQMWVASRFRDDAGELRETLYIPVVLGGPLDPPELPPTSPCPWDPEAIEEWLRQHPQQIPSTPYGPARRWSDQKNCLVREASSSGGVALFPLLLLAVFTASKTFGRIRRVAA